MVKITLPAPKKDAFHCPTCHVYAKQHWFDMTGTGKQYRMESHTFEKFEITRCERCKSPAIWKKSQMIYPNTGVAEPANSDLPDDIKDDYEEARVIAAQSPRGAAALLRLSIQKLCAHLGQPGKNINDDIKALVAKGLPSQVQQALDTVRVIGNNAVHPGSIDLTDDVDTVNSLFKLVNFIAEKMITDPKEIEAIYNSLPQKNLDSISKRDEKK